MMSNLPTQIAQYEVLHEIGSGRFGTVYAGRDTRLGIDVTLKMLKAELSNDQAIIQVFEREANTLARLNHPNLGHVLSFDLHHSPPYLVTEQVKGQRLSDFLAQKGNLSLSETVPLLRQIAAALDLAHHKGFVHRHLTPESIFITNDRQVKLVDFGLIKRKSTNIVNDLGHAVDIASANYVAPEQTEITRQHEISSSTDIYAFGVITYQMLTGRLPFEGSPEAVMAAHQAALPPNPRLFNSKLPPPIANVLLQVLSKEARNRFASADGLVRALEQAAKNDNPTRTYSSAARQNRTVTPNGTAVTATEQQVRSFSGARGSFKTNSSSSEPATKVLKLPGSNTASHSGKRTYGKGVIAFVLLLVLALLGGISANRFLPRQLFGRQEPQQTIPAVPDAQILSEEGLYMRVGPGLEYEIISMYPTDTALRIIGRDLESMWVQVEAIDGQLGWMYAPLLQVNIDLNEVDFAPAPLAPLRQQL